MDDVLERNLFQWLRGQRIKKDGTERLVRVELLHSAAKGPESLEVFDIDKETPEGDIVDMIRAAAERDCESLGGKQTYVVRPYHEGSRKAGSPYRFRLNAPNADDAEDSLDSEPPTEKGLVRQAMRHTEVALQFNFKSQTLVTDALHKQIARLTKRNEELEERLDKVGKMYEELTTMRHERELMTIQAEAKERRIDNIVDSVRPLLPAMTQKLLGTEISKDSHPALIQLQAFAKSLTPEQLAQLTQVLKPEQALQVMTLMDAAL